MIWDKGKVVSSQCVMQSHSRAPTIPLVINKSRPRIKFIFIPLEELHPRVQFWLSLCRILACAFCILAPAGPLALDGFESECCAKVSEREKRVGLSGRQYPSPFSPSGGFNSISPALWQLTFSARGQKFLACTSLHHCPCVSLAPLGGVYSFKRSLERQTKLSLSSCATRTLQFASQINGLALDNALLVQNPLNRRPSYYCGCFICDSFAAGASAQRPEQSGCFCIKRFWSDKQVGWGAFVTITMSYSFKFKSG